MTLEQDPQLPKAAPGTYQALVDLFEKNEQFLRPLYHPVLQAAVSLVIPEQVCQKYGCSCMDSIIRWYRVTENPTPENNWQQSGALFTGHIHVTNSDLFDDYDWQKGSYDPESPSEHRWDFSSFTRDEANQPTPDEVLHMIQTLPPQNWAPDGKKFAHRGLKIIDEIPNKLWLPK